MEYVVSDIHGHYDKYIQLLQRLALGPEDTLYVLGDVLDRGPEGIRILLDMAERPNVVGFLGNHELAALMCLPWLLKEINEETCSEALLTQRLQDLIAWKSDGGDATIREFAKLSPERRLEALEALRDLMVYEEIEVEGKFFLLVHAGLGNFSPARDLGDYSLDEIILTRPDLNQDYFPDKYLVFGHTPTPLLFSLESGRQGGKHPAKIFRKGTLIGIDCGCAFGGPLGCLCLNTMEEIYIT